MRQSRNLAGETQRAAEDVGGGVPNPQSQPGLALARADHGSRAASGSPVFHPPLIPLRHLGSSSSLRRDSALRVPRSAFLYALTYRRIGHAFATCLDTTGVSLFKTRRFFRSDAQVVPAMAAAQFDGDLSAPGFRLLGAEQYGAPFRSVGHVRRRGR